MGKPSCVFSARDRGGAGRRRAFSSAAGILLVLSGAGEGLVRADPAPPGLPPAPGAEAATGVSAPSGLDPAFLLLPAHDLEFVAPPARTPQVGDRLELRVTGFTLDVAAVPAGTVAVKAELPPGGGEPLNDQGFEITPRPGAQAGTLSLLAIPLKPGRLVVPALMLKDAADKPVARTNPFNVDVNSAIKPDDPKPTVPVELRPPVGLAFPWWVIVAAALLLLLAGAGIVLALRQWSLKHRKPALPELPEGPPRPDDEVALEELLEIERQGLIKKGQYKSHYFRVSEIMKRYVGARYRFDAIESTTREIIGVLEEKKLVNDQVIDRVESLFERLDRVKFTDHVPRPEDGAAVLEEARKLILNTRRPPAVAPLTPPTVNQNAV